MSDSVLKNIGSSEANRLQAFMSSMYIIEYGIIKKIPAEGIVTVEMSVAESKEDIIVTNCVYANLASSSFSMNMKPNVDDKVLVLFPRKFVGGMFKAENNEPLISECSNGYTIMGGIAIPLNQYQEATHKNFVDISDGCITLKLAYSEGDSKNLLTLTSDAYGAFVLMSNKVQVEVNKDSEITVTNGKATITVDKNGNVTIDAQGKYTIKNGVTSLKKVTDGLAKELENLTTTGSPATQATSPASKGTIATWRSSQLNQLFAE